VVDYPKPDILAALCPDHHAVIEASAGTGKTFLIEHLVMELLLTADVPLEQILVVTFTEKATAELKARLRSSLTRLLTADQPTTTPEGPYWRLDDAARSRLERALRAFGSAPIFTIHGFCQRVLTEHAFNHRRLFSQSQVESETAFERAFRATLRHEFARDPEQQIWLRKWLESFSLHELQNLLSRCLHLKTPMRPLFAVEAFTTALRRLQTLIGSPQSLQAVLTEVESAPIHAGTKKAILRRMEVLAAFLDAWDDTESVPALLGAVDRKSVTYLHDRLMTGAFTPAPDSPGAQFCEALSAFYRLCVPFAAAIVQQFLPAIERRLIQDKQRHGWYDFDDMLSLVWDGLQGPHASVLLETLRQRYRYALIDEFQDTDPIQWQIFRRLFLDSDGSNILYGIGDPKQAIYAFRGADVHTYLEAREAIQAVAGTRVSLTHNYRSTATLIDALNGVFAEDAAVPFFNGAIRYDTPVQCGAPNWLALDRCGRESAPLHILQLRPAALPLSAALARQAFGRCIARTIKELLPSAAGICSMEGESRDEGELWIGAAQNLRPVSASDVFILTRTGNEGMEIAQYLQAEGVPYAFYKQDGLFQTADAQAIYDVLMAVAFPHEQSTRFKAWLTPFFGLSLEALTACHDLPGAHPLMQRLLTWKNWADRKAFAPLFADILNSSGFVRRELFLNPDGRSLTNVQHILEVLLEETRHHNSTLPELLLTLKAFITGTRRPVGEHANVQRLAHERDAVQIMTMHKSKGLEAAVVFLYGGFARAPGGQIVVCHEGDTRVAHVEPDDEARNAARREEEEEEQRLLYVAMTRAKARLYLPYIEPSRYPERFQGCHRRLNTRLTHVLSDPAYAAVQARCALHRFTVESLQEPAAALREPESLSHWRPPAALFETVDESEHFQRYRQQHAAFVVSSYSRLKQADGGYHPAMASLELSRDGLQTIAVPRSETDLPGGTLSGRFVHELLEQVALDSFIETSCFDTWRARLDISDLFTRLMRRYARDTQYLDASQRLVYTGFTTPIALQEGISIPSLAACQPFLRETEFLYPIPEAAHSRLSDLPVGPFRIEKGYIKGYVDFLCRYDGLHYVGDWKTDRLPAYSCDILASHIQQNYTWQIKLYALALVKMLRIHSEADYQHRFGGMLYCFLRGMSQRGNAASGVLFSRPSWIDILDYEAELMQRQTFA
jgi:exodeoxyribonuclease V beta subunit